MKRKFLWRLLLTLPFFCTNAWAFNIASKWQTTGPVIHTTFFITPGNDLVDLKAQAYVGTLNNGNCVYADIFNMGAEKVQTGDFIDYDAFKIKSLLGTSYDCMTVYYTVNQFVFETFSLFFDGFNYYDTYPENRELRLM